MTVENVLPFGRGSDDAQYAGPTCPICGNSGPHNHSLLEVEAFHRSKENEDRNFGLVTFRTDEVFKLIKVRARGMNDRSHFKRGSS
jgi:hypothetical protein